jgi:hypothetical protein
LKKGVARDHVLRELGLEPPNPHGEKSWRKSSNPYETSHIQEKGGFTQKISWRDKNSVRMLTKTIKKGKLLNKLFYHLLPQCLS